jgi:hypothetical protein
MEDIKVLGTSVEEAEEALHLLHCPSHLAADGGYQGRRTTPHGGALLQLDLLYISSTVLPTLQQMEDIKVLGTIVVDPK